jgi:twinkle protein
VSWQAEIVTPADLIGDVLDIYREGLQGGLSTGWPSVDAHYAVVPGLWTVVTGYPGSGKSEWVDALCLNLAEMHNWRFAFYSPENQPQQLHLAKIMEKRMGKPFFDGPTQRMSSNEILECTEWLQKRFAFIKQTEGPKSIEEILKICWGWLNHSGRTDPAGIVIDPWNELDHHQPAGLTESQYISKSLQTIRHFARNNNCHIWLVAHPKLVAKEDGKRPVPTLSDISGGAMWWNKADFGIAVHRDQSENNNDTQIHIQKVRFKHMGKQGMVILKWERVTGQYSEAYMKVTPLHEYRKANPVT